MTSALKRQSRPSISATKGCKPRRPQHLEQSIVDPDVSFKHRWAITPISVICDSGLSLISELPISD
jgi:hypothetical protein